MIIAFCGLEVITYCMMSNHFHVLIRVPEPIQLTDGQLVERLEALYGARGALTLLAREAMSERGKIKEVIAQVGELSLGQVLRLRVWHMSEGVALGTREFVNEVFARHREKSGKKRKDGARPIRALSAFGLTALRNLRVRALG